jgi:mannose/cellobiose epimerase-like protein (N-acyl-D-glucosamine 2-epimerase family)
MIGDAREEEGPLIDAATLAATWRKKLPRGAAGFAEAVGPGWKDAGDGARTMLCQSRLAFVFTHAGFLGDGDCAALGAASIEAMNGRFWHPAARGWLRALDASGKPVDERVDTYDQAFGLLALAWHFRAAASRETRDLALAALEALDLAAKGAGIEGYPEWRDTRGRPAPPATERRQNPHMHLLEAFLAWHEADPEGPWLERARAIIGLFRRRFVQRQNGSLAEFFDAKFSVAPGAAGAIRESGHHFEWIWLLRRWEEAASDDGARADADGLWSFAAAAGIDTDGLAFDRVDWRGRVLAETKLLWPQTELLKAYVARHEWTGDPLEREGARRTLAALASYFPVKEPALFHSQLDRLRHPMAMPTLSRLLYHLYLALMECERVFGEPSSS